MNCTLDQYIGLSALESWWRKYNHQIITIDSRIGCGVWDLIQFFFGKIGLDHREICYLSYNQKQVLRLAYGKMHAYYIDGFLYDYKKSFDVDTLEAITKKDTPPTYTWVKYRNKKIDPKYKLIVVFDATLLTKKQIKHLCSYGLPIILLQDTKLIPGDQPYTFFHDANIVLRQVHPWYSNHPIVHFAHQMLLDVPLKLGNYDGVNIIGKSKLNLYNMKSSNMIITLNDDTRTMINHMYREKVLSCKDSVTKVGERLIVTKSIYDHILENSEESRVKVYLHKNAVGYVSKINKHAQITRWVPIEFKLDEYTEPFEDISLDRYVLNHIDGVSKQIIPDDILETEYAYALTPDRARYHTWDKVLLLMEPTDYDDDLQRSLLYTAITRAEKFVNIVL